MIKHGKEDQDFPESYNPFTTVELPDETAVDKKTKEIQILPLECLERFKEVALGYNPDGTLAYRYGPALVFALNTGLREGELLALSKKGIITGEDGQKTHISETLSIVKNRDEKVVRDKCLKVPIQKLGQRKNPEKSTFSRYLRGADRI